MITWKNSNLKLIIIFSLICKGLKNAEMQTLYNFSGALLPIFIGNNCQQDNFILLIQKKPIVITETSYFLNNVNDKANDSIKV